MCIVVGERSRRVRLIVMRWVVAVVALLGMVREGLAAAPANAPDPVREAQDHEAAAQWCAAAWTLTSLRVDERELVFALCVLGETSDGELSVKGSVSKARIERLITGTSRVKARNSWQLERLVELLPASLIPPSKREATAVTPQAREVTLVVGDATQAIVLIDGIFGIETAKVTDESKKVTVSVHASELVVIGKGPKGRPTFVRRISIDGKTDSEKGDEPIEISLATPEQETLGCLDLQVAKDDRSELWLDGKRIEAGPQPVRLGVPHTLTVMHRGAAGTWIVEVEETLAERHYATECSLEELDLRSSKGIALTPVGVDDSCGDFGPSGSAVWGDAARFIEQNAPRAGLTFRDLNGVATAAHWLEDVRHSLTSLGGEPVGASRGDRATEREIATAGAELWRQGVRQVVSLEVQCRRDPRTSGLRLSVVGRILDLETLHESNHDSVAGVDLDGLIEVDTEVISDLDAVEPAVRRLVARLLDLRYLFFAEFRRQVWFSQEISVVVELIDPAEGPEHHLEVTPSFDAFAPDRSMAAAICPGLEATGRIAGRPPEEVTLGRRMAAPHWEEQSHSSYTRTFMLHVDPRQPGPVILRATWASSQGRLAEYRCIDVIQAPRMLTGELSIGAAELGREHAQRSSLRTSLTVDFLSPLRDKREWFHLGVGGGLNLMTRRYDALPSWDGLPTAAEAPPELFVDDGNTSLEWNRYGLVLGPRAAGVWRPLCWRTERRAARGCGSVTRRFLLTVMGSVDLDVGFFDAERLPEAFSAARGELPLADFDLDVSVKALLGYQLSSRQVVSLGLTLWLPGIDDRIIASFQRQYPRERSSPDYDFFPMLGGTLRYGWSL